MSNPVTPTPENEYVRGSGVRNARLYSTYFATGVSRLRIRFVKMPTSGKSHEASEVIVMDADGCDLSLHFERHHTQQLYDALGAFLSDPSDASSDPTTGKGEHNV